MVSELRENSAGSLRILVGTAGVLFCHFLALVVLIGVLVTAVSHYLIFCKEWNLMLPPVTNLAVDLSLWMSAWWYLLVLALVPDGIVYFLLARLKPSLNWCAAIWAIVPLVFTILILGLVTIGVCLPLDHLRPVPNTISGTSTLLVLPGPAVSGGVTFGKETRPTLTPRGRRAVGPTVPGD